MISQSKLSKSKTKLVLHNIPSADLLYKGYQRKLSQQQYIKNFPRFKLNLQNKNNTLSSSKCSQNQALFFKEIVSLKQQNKRLQDLNLQLKIKIKKESKMNQIYQKRVQNKSVEDISFQKLLEIKLLMEVEQFQEILKKKQEELYSITKLTKNKKEEVDNINYTPFIALHEILLEDSNIQEFKKQKQTDLQKLEHVLQTKSKKKLKLKNYHKKLIQELNILKSDIQKEKNIMKHIPKNIEDNDNGIQTIQNKNKNIEEIQAEITKIIKESNDYEIKIQKEMDKKISQKILILNEIEELSLKKSQNQSLERKTVKLIW